MSSCPRRLSPGVEGTGRALGTEIGVVEGVTSGDVIGLVVVIETGAGLVVGPDLNLNLGELEPPQIKMHLLQYQGDSLKGS